MIPIKGLHIELTNICTLKCPGCARTKFIQQWPKHWKNHNLDINQTLKFLDIDLTGVAILLNGNYGDPIYHPEFLEFINALKNRGAYLHITTNGSYQTSNWWNQLTNMLTVDDTIEFSVDGTPENFTQYRINANWNSIKLGMEICAKSKCHSIWKFIPFNYNQTDIESVREFSKQLGIKEFVLRLSDRFDDDTNYLMPDPALLRDRYSSMIEWKQKKEVHGITAKCQNGNQHFITAEGYYSPCCWQADHRFYYKNIFGKHKKQYSIGDTTLTEILKRNEVNDFFTDLIDQPGCQYNCPKVSAH